MGLFDTVYLDKKIVKSLNLSETLLNEEVDWQTKSIDMPCMDTFYIRNGKIYKKINGRYKKQSITRVFTVYTIFVQNDERYSITLEFKTFDGDIITSKVKQKEYRGKESERLLEEKKLFEEFDKQSKLINTNLYYYLKHKFKKLRQKLGRFFHKIGDYLIFGGWR
jgi:hypothetical protein